MGGKFNLNIKQLRNSVSRLALAIESSGLMPAVKDCRNQLSKESQTARQNEAEASLSRVSDDYLRHAQGFSVDDDIVAGHLHLRELGSQEYWRALCDISQPQSERLRELILLYSRLMFASGHLPALLALIGETVDTGAVGQRPELTAESFTLELTHWTDAKGTAKTELSAGPCLLYTSPSPRDATLSRMPSSA